ncbi:thermonuclease family protein [Epibacterium sp. DP7N7-1]|nr:thermonuclease family protein [Epibacterium sp. DP7N7-1]
MRREEAFRIRLFSVNTPEKPLRRGSEESLRRAGVDPHADSPGRQASLLVKALCKDRALYIEPEANKNGNFTDRYGRLLANVCLSGSRGQDFDTESAYTLGPALVRRGYASPMRGKEIPPDVPYAIWQLNQHQKDQHTFSTGTTLSF